MTFGRREFLGIAFDEADLESALDWVRAHAGGPGFRYLVTPNVDHVVRLQREPLPEVGMAYKNADLCLCDSRILGLLARVSGVPLQIVPGSDLTSRLIRQPGLDQPVLVVGGTAALHSSLARAFPQWDWRFHEPPMGVLGDANARRGIADFVEANSPALTLFAIGAPQSELCCHEIAVRNRARGVALCIGASLEFLVGEKRRAPRWMQRMNLEWLHRLLSEPRRLWRRYLVEGPRILAVWWRWRRQR